MVMFSSARDNLRIDLIKAYNDLSFERRLSIGYTVDGTTIESNEDADDIDERYNTLRGSTLGRSAIRVKLAGLIKKNNERVIRYLLLDIKGVSEQYLNKTSVRAKYGLLAPLAFCPKENLPVVMGTGKPEEVFGIAWHIEFQQLTLEQEHIGLLDVTCISTDGLNQWWFEGRTDYNEEMTSVWADIKCLALRLVCILEGTENCKIIADVRTRFRKLTLGVARLVYLSHEHLDAIRPLFELLVPLCHAFSLFLKTKDVPTQQAVSFLESYLSLMESSLEDVVVMLNISNEMERYEQPDNKELDRETLAEKSEAAELRALNQRALSNLRDLGLTHIRMAVQGPKPWLGSGSFSTVYQYSSEDGLNVFAAKFFKPRKADHKRTQKRLIREAKRWFGLSHERINVLLGFCIDPDEALPGLVSMVCECTLHGYLNKRSGVVGNEERLRYLKEIGEALQYLQGVRLAHGDLRPMNVFLVTDPSNSRKTVKLSDFGVSYIEDSQEITTTMQHTNEAYLAPELKVAKKKEGFRQVSLKGDIYAFGCCFLEIFYDGALDSKTVRCLKKENKPKDTGPKVPIESAQCERYIQIDHWKFLQSAWEEKPENRPLAEELVKCMVAFGSS